MALRYLLDANICIYSADAKSAFTRQTLSYSTIIARRSSNDAVLQASSASTISDCWAMSKRVGLVGAGASLLPQGSVPGRTVEVSQAGQLLATLFRN